MSHEQESMDTHAGVRARRSISHRPGWAGVPLALVLMVVASLIVAPSASAADLSPRIGATRSSQTALEATMLRADHRIRELRRSLRPARERQHHAARGLRRARERARSARTDVAVAQRRLDGARHARDATMPPAVTNAAGPLDLGFSSDLVPAFVIPDPDATPVPRSAPSWPLPSPAVAATSGATAAATDAAVQAATTALREARHRLRQSRREVSRARHRLHGRHRALVARRQRLAVTIGSRSSVEAALGATIKRMTDLAQERARKLTKVRPAHDGFVWPVHGRVTQPYGCTGFRLEPGRGSCAHFHAGVDIAAFRGAPVRAAAGGVIAYVGWNPWDHGGRAFMVVIGHAGGYETLYGHLLPVRRVTPGRVVRQGQLIGLMGATGHATGPHVHWAVSRGFVTMDPLLVGRR